MAEVPFNRTFYDCVSSVLILLLISMVGYDAYVFFQMNVYKTYSTSCLLLSCIMLLMFRIISLTVFILEEDPTSSESSFVGSLFLDFPVFLLNLITLCLIYQWLEIEKWLRAPQ